MPKYPMLRFLERHGDWVAVLLALTPPAAAVWWLVLGGATGWLAAGLGAGVVVYLVFKSYVELVRVMIDMLLPK